MAKETRKFDRGKHLTIFVHHFSYVMSKKITRMLIKFIHRRDTFEYYYSKRKKSKGRCKKKREEVITNFTE